MLPTSVKKLAGLSLAALLLTTLFATVALANATVTIESWRIDDKQIWTNTIIPAFTKSHPDIAVVFSPMPPAGYDAGLGAKLAAGTAGDLITCRPFDASLELFQKGHLVGLDDLEGMHEFSAVAKSAWQTDDGKSTFAVPMASVIHGFIYNMDAFEKLNLSVPTTEAEFFAVLDKVKVDGSYIPLAMGTADKWEAATMGFQNIGPNHWQGEKGRKALIAGTAKLTDKPYIDTWRQLAKWSTYMGEGFATRSCQDSQRLFTEGRAAIYPAGSWDIATFNAQAKFKFGAFPPPLPAGAKKGYICDHTDIALGLNTASKNKDAARTFLTWTTTAEFADLYANALPGFFPESNHKVHLKDPVAQQFLDWRTTHESTIRNSSQILSRGVPNLETQLWNVSAQVINTTLPPQQAGEQTASGLEKWYKPQQ